MRPRLPPVALLTLAFIAGCAAVRVFASPLSHVPSLTPLALLVLPFLRPARAESSRRAGRIHLAVAVAVLAGAALTHARRQTAEGDCRLHLPEGAQGLVSGWFETVPGPGARPFRLVDGLGCHGEVRVLWRPPNSTQLGAGQPVTATARWQRSPRREAHRPQFAGVLVLDDVRAGVEPLGFRAARARARLRGRVEIWIRQLFPDTWPVASALILARKEGLDP